jgi:hypothetical protein
LPYDLKFLKSFLKKEFCEKNLGALRPGPLPQSGKKPAVGLMPQYRVGPARGVHAASTFDTSEGSRAGRSRAAATDD